MCVHCNYNFRTLFSWTVVDHQVQHKSLCQIPIFIKSQMNFHLKCNPVNWKRILSGTMCYMPWYNGNNNSKHCSTFFPLNSEHMHSSSRHSSKYFFGTIQDTHILFSKPVLRFYLFTCFCRHTYNTIYEHKSFAELILTTCLINQLVQ